jgi:hypothetical protein
MESYMKYGRDLRQESTQAEEIYCGSIYEIDK